MDVHLLGNLYDPFSYNSVVSIDFATLPLDIYLNIAVVVLGGTFFAYLLVPIGQRILRPTVATMYNYVQPSSHPSSQS